ncbi:MAG TPA: serine/threonine-protein kinase [Nostocaceae cyanobacterium]|nr:serine/threonine-protein kinase [Nostocaceae cyanobacterium]
MRLWMPKQQLNNGRFVIQKILGSGGFGVTYSAKEQLTGNLVVIKTLNHIQQSKRDFEQRQVKFVNEALRLAKCTHPHIVEVYEVIQEEGLWGMVMEFIDGKDLAVYVEQQGKLSTQEALLYINQIGLALEYVHQQGFLHRDVKPSNIIVRPDKSAAVLIDFGLAREYTQGQIESITNDRTNGYAPIEQYNRRGNFGAYTDVYALAATLYTLLTKEVPIPAESRLDGTILVPPQEYNREISDRINDAIMKGMEIQPELRTQSISEFRKSLGLTITTSAEEELLSAVGIKYNKLRDLLLLKKWQQADEETTRLMLLITGKENDGWLSEGDINNLPCADLQTMDKLWSKYSYGRFGFAVQKRIFHSLGGGRKIQKEVWNNFGDTVGWRKDKKWKYYNDLTFDITAPSGHLPGGVFWFDSWWGRYGWFLIDGVEKRFTCLVERMGQCNF